MSPTGLRLISIRKQMEEADHFASRFDALRQAHLALTGALPDAGRAADPELAERVKALLDRAALAVLYDASPRELEQAGTVALEQLTAISRSNTTAIEERDAALKEVAVSFADFIKSFKGDGERHSTTLQGIATEFDTLSRLEDVNELRRRLREDVVKLRTTVEAMRSESEESVRNFESQIVSFQDRLEMARKESGLDRLTGLGNRREAEQHLRQIEARKPPVCVLLFNIDGFREINRRNGAPFGDKVLQALAHTLVEYFPEKDSLFRWGADEFMVVAEGRLQVRLDGCRRICQQFAANTQYTVDGGARRVTADVTSGGTEYQPGDSPEALHRRARQNLELARGG
jgi:diguanylate cyclase (GGDEF)-like protein